MGSGCYYFFLKDTAILIYHPLNERTMPEIVEPSHLDEEKNWEEIQAARRGIEIHRTSHDEMQDGRDRNVKSTTSTRNNVVQATS